MEVKLSYGGCANVESLYDWCVLKTMLQEAGFDYTFIEYNPNIGIKAPYLVIDGVTLDFKRSSAYLKEIIKKLQ